MAISDSDIASALSGYLGRYPDEEEALFEPMQWLSQGSDFASRRTFPMHVTAGALLVRDDAEILLISHRAYGNLLLQPGGHLEQSDDTLMDAALRELTEETDVDPALVFPASPADPVYIEYGRVPARPEKDEPEHYHLDFGYAFTTVSADIGSIQESEVTGAAWYPIQLAKTIVGPRILRGSVAQLG